MEQLGYNLLFRWFVGLSLDAVVWDVRVFTKKRARLIAGELRPGGPPLQVKRVLAFTALPHYSKH
jgi:transposase-like protein DUF772